MKTVALVAAVLMLAGCTHDNSKHHPQETEAPASQNPVIVHIVSRHEKVTITASPRGPLYSVRTDEGKTLVADATLEELKRDHADVYQRIAPAIARDEIMADERR